MLVVSATTRVVLPGGPRQARKTIKESHEANDGGLLHAAPAAGRPERGPAHDCRPRVDLGQDQGAVTVRPSPAPWLAVHGTQTAPTGVVAALIPLGLRIAAVVTAAAVLTAIAKALPAAIRAFQDHRSDIIRAKGAARAQVIQARTIRIRARTMRRASGEPGHPIMLPFAAC